MSKVKPVYWVGSSLDDLRAFPDKAMDEAGHQLHNVQTGLEPDDYKPFPEIGKGVRELRIRKSSGAFRVIYVAKFSKAVYVLHAFQKKTQKTRKQDIEIAKNRYKLIINQE